MILLGIDPGYDRCGWAVLRVQGRIYEPLAFDTIQTTSTHSKYERFRVIFLMVQDLISRHTIREIAVEEVFFSRNVSTALPISEVRGLLYALALASNIPVFEYKPNVIKQTVAGHGQADKHQVLNMLQKQLRLEKIPKIDDTGDALAVALTHAIHRSSRLQV